MPGRWRLRKAVKTNRDEFPAKTKQALALRASYRCSFADYPQITVGPSDESPKAVTVIGKAAHIRAAAPGGRRYLESMTSKERSDISNGIWLCTNHADLIDRDDVTYTADVLRVMKREHQASCAARLRNAIIASDVIPDLIAIGPEIICAGEFLAAGNSEWSLRLRDFVEGDLHGLLTFIDGYEKMAAADRYVLVNALRDGRALKGAPSVTRESAGGYGLRCPVYPSADRIRATDLPADLALSDNHDLMLEGNSIAVVSGLDALPQHIETRLSLQKEESPFHPDFGVRFAEYYKLFAGSVWFGQLLKLELIRQVAIPYVDAIMKRQYTPLMCVERVFAIETLADTQKNNWLPIRVDLQLKAVGRWQRKLSICIPQTPREAAVP